MGIEEIGADILSARVGGESGITKAIAIGVGAGITDIANPVAVGVRLVVVHIIRTVVAGVTVRVAV